MAFVPRLHIHHLGPIEDCDILMNRMMVLDGPQAAGKSTVAKAIFFFRTVKDLIFRRIFSERSDLLHLDVEYYLVNKFMQIFGLNYHIDADIKVSYYYAENVKITIYFSEESNPHLKVTMSDDILTFLREYENLSEGAISEGEKIREQLDDLFHDFQETVYIPAGRSMISLLAKQLTYIFVMLDDKQKNMIDYCTRNHIEQILKIKPFFEGGSEAFHRNLGSQDDTWKFTEEMLLKNMQRILHGQYEYLKGDEYFSFNSHGDQRKIKINFASSGQQEVLWILNIIFYYVLAQKKCCFIIEEPEAHLYPDAQKEIVEYIALALVEMNEGIITTHSPYILGALNNLLDARRVMDQGIDIIGLLEKYSLLEQQLLNRDEFSAYFVHDGKLEDAMDEETGMIRNELIDGASDRINSFADELFEMEYRNHE